MVSTKDFGSFGGGSIPPEATKQILKAYICKHTIRMFETAISRNANSSYFYVCTVCVPKIIKKRVNELLKSTYSI